MSKTDHMKRRCTDCNLTLSPLELDIDGNCPKCHEPCMIRWPKKDLPKNWPYNSAEFFTSNTGFKDPLQLVFPAEHPAWYGKIDISKSYRPFDPQTIYAALDRISKENTGRDYFNGREIPAHVAHHIYCHANGVPHSHEGEEE